MLIKGYSDTDHEVDHALYKPRIMNKIGRRPVRSEHNKPPARGYRPGLWTECFNMVISPSLDSYWADCLRYMCSIERRSQFRTSKNNASSGSVALVVSQPRLQRPLSPVMSAKKPRIVLSFISWDHRHRDLRGLLAHALNANAHFAEGYVLSAIEVDASEEMGEPLPWYPVAHMARDYRLNMYPREIKRQDKKTLGNNFTLLQDSYYEHAKLTLVLDKGSRLSPSPPTGGAAGNTRLRNQLVLAYKSLEDSTDPNLLEGWVRWSGAWEAYTLLQDRRLPVATITLYVRENFPTKVPKETFKYVVMLEIVTHGPDEVQQLRAATQRLRVERWSGYICLYTEHSLMEFSDNFASNDSISKIVEDVM